MRRNRGVALLEVLIALTIVSVTGLSVVGALHDAMIAEQVLAVREREMARADQLLSAYALLDRRDLEQRIGSQVDGACLIRVQRPTATLFRVSVADTAAPDVEVLVTVLHRPAGVP
jgi:prepilin-type N-terminal cleavage/methylation domain-containing protein